MAAAAALLKGLPLMVIDGIYQVASTRVGQSAIVFFDHILCIVEAINFYAAPAEQQQEARQESKEMQDFQRPLPWFLFIPMLFYFRIVRGVMSVVGLLFHMQGVSAMMVVYYMQSMRRKLRYVKIQGSRMMSNPDQKASSSLPWIARAAINLFTWGPLQVFTIIARLVLGNKHYNVYASANQPRSKRSLKKLKASDSDECSTAELLDKFADEDGDDAVNDPDFEVKSTDLASESTDEEEEGDEENSEPEEDTEVKENGATKEGEPQPENENHEENNHQANNGQQPQDNHNEQNHHQEEHHHY